MQLRWPYFGLLVLTCVLWSFPVWVQSEPSLYVDRVDVNVVNVDVYVTDGQGRPVSDLTLDDFELFEDGKQVEITNFYVGGDLSVSSVTESTSGQVGSVVTQREQTDLVTGQSERPHHLMVYVDHFNLTPTNRKRVFDQLGSFLEERLVQGDQIMMVGYDRTLEVVQPFTRDAQLLADGLAAMSKVATQRQIQDQERARIMRALAAAVQEDSPRAQSSSALVSMLMTSHIQQVRSDLEHSVRAIERAVSVLSGLSGRKSLLYVSDGLAQRPGAEIFEYLASLDPQNSDPSLLMREDQSNLFRGLTRAANAHGVSFYTLDARGTKQETASAEFHGDLGAQRSVFESVRALNYQEPLLTMADATGGSAILNTLNFANVLDKISEQFESFYSLGYVSNFSGDGEYHRLKVKLKRPGLKLRHRRGFVDKPMAEQVADQTLAALMRDDPAVNPMGIQLGFGEVTKKRKGRYHLPVMLRIPFEQITLLPKSGTYEGSLRIFVVVRDEEGLSETQQIPYPLSVAEAQIAQGKGQDIGWSTKLLLRSGEPIIAIGVLDEVSGIESFVRGSVEVGNRKASRSKSR